MNINLVKASATVITKRAAYYENLIKHNQDF